MQKKLFSNLLAIAVVLLSPVFLSASGDTSGDTIEVKVKILSASSLSIETEGDLLVKSGYFFKKEFTFNGQISVKPRGFGFYVNKKKISSNIMEVHSVNGNIIYVNKRGYRGFLIIEKEGRYCRVVNQIDVEKYLYGIIRSEISPRWNVEAIKAQAVVSRTYAVAALAGDGKHADEGYHLCCTNHCQVYAGVSGESGVSNDAIDQTRGEVLAYDTKLAEGFFHSTCGGFTENIENVWKESEKPHLVASECGFCTGSPYFFWKYRISEVKLRGVLRANGFRIKKIDGIVPEEFGTHGRISKLGIVYGYNKIILKLNDFRLMVGPNSLKSGIFEVGKTGGYFEFEGKGFGHGVGLCQWGMKAMADSGHDYKSILKRYFKGTEVEKIESIGLSSE